MFGWSQLLWFGLKHQRNKWQTRDAVSECFWQISVVEVSAEHHRVWRRMPFCRLIFGSQDPTFPMTFHCLSARSAMPGHQSLLKWPTPDCKKQRMWPFKSRCVTLCNLAWHHLSVSQHVTTIHHVGGTLELITTTSQPGLSDASLCGSVTATKLCKGLL